MKQRKRRKKKISQRKAFIATLKSDPMTYDEQRKNPNLRFHIAEAIRERVKDGGEVDRLCNVFGEVKGCDGIAEEVIKPKEGGTFVKLYGCSILFKSFPKKERLLGLGLSKALFSEVPREIIAKSKVLMFSIGFLFLFQRKKFIKMATSFMDMLLHRTEEFQIPDKEYNINIKEFKRACAVGLTNENNVWSPLIARFIRFFAIFLESDNAYRFRLQDALEESKKRGNITIFSVLDVLIERETGDGIAHKWKFIKKVVKFLFFLSPKLKRISKSILKELDIDKVKMDESDWYFCLRFISYDFGGMNREDRYALRDKIDKEKGHIFVL